MSNCTVVNSKNNDFSLIPPFPKKEEVLHARKELVRLNHLPMIEVWDKLIQYYSVLSKASFVSKDDAEKFRRNALDAENLREKLDLEYQAVESLRKLGILKRL